MSGENAPNTKANEISEAEVLDLLRLTGVLQEGHFQLSSGLHSDTYFQCALVLQHPEHAARLCAALAARLADERIEVVVGPALGGVTFAYELARQLGVRGIFTERQEGRMTLRRGFQVTPGERVLVAEDAVTTGGSAAEAAEVMRAAGADVVAVAAVVDRSSGKADFGVRFEALARVTVQQFPPEECPLCARGVPIHKPGSRPGAMSSKDQSSTKGE